MLVVGERPGSVAVEVERAEADGADLEREAEDGPRAGLDGRAGEGQPAGRAGVGQIGLEHRPVLVVGVDARPLAERRTAAPRSARSPRRWCTPSPAGTSPDMSMIPAPLIAGDLGAHLAQPLGLRCREGRGATSWPRMRRRRSPDTVRPSRAGAGRAIDEDARVSVLDIDPPGHQGCTLTRYRGPEHRSRARRRLARHVRVVACRPQDTPLRPPRYRPGWRLSR